MIMNKKNVYSETILVTEEIAKNWLDTINTQNRNMSKNYVKFLAQQMRDGLWHQTSATIGIDYNGILADGQHRLEAIVSTGIAQYMNIVYNVEPFNGLVSAGKIRTSLDNFVAVGIDINNYTASSMKTFAKALLRTNMRVNDSVLIDLHHVFGGEMDSARKFCRGLCPKNGVSYSSSFTVAYFLLRPFHLNTKLDRLFEQVLNGSYLVPKTEVKYYYERMAKGGQQQNKHSVEEFFCDMENLMEYTEKVPRKKRSSQEELHTMYLNAIDHFNKIWKESHD